MQKSLFHLSQHLLFPIIFIALDSIRGVVIAMHRFTMLNYYTGAQKTKDLHCNFFKM